MAEEPLIPAKKVINLTMAALKSLDLYPVGHPQTIGAIEALWHAVFAYLKLRAHLVIVIDKGQIFHDGDLMIEETLSCQDLVGACRDRRINRITFYPGLEQEELAGFLSLLKADAGPGGPDFEAALVSADVRHIKIMRHPTVQSDAVDVEMETDSTDHRHYELAVGGLSEIFGDARMRKPVSLAKIGSIVHWVVKRLAGGNQGIIALTALRDNNEYLSRHSVNVAILSTVLGSAAGLDQPELKRLGTAALLHDIGKVLIPKEILDKPERLTADELTAVKAHPSGGALILSKFPMLHQSAMVVAYEHHVGCDLSGYPTLTEKRVPHFFSRLVQIADTYDSLTSDRSYHVPYLSPQAWHFMLKVAPGSFDQALLKLFINALGVYPLGSVVKLTGDRCAVVVGQTPDLLKPIVKLPHNGSGPIDLTEQTGVQILEAVSAKSADIDLVAEFAAFWQPRQSS